LFPFISDVDGDGTFDLSSPDHSVSGGLNDPYTDWIDWRLPTDISPGQSGYYTIVSSLQSIPDPTVWNGGEAEGVGDEIFAKMVLVNFNGGTTPPYSRQLPETGTTFRIITAKPNKPGDTFSFQTQAPEISVELSKHDLNKINVFPNPYFGGSTLERDRYNRFVTFTHLPEKATIRIFTLSGIFVRKIDHNGTQYEKWDLINSSNWMIASGMYLVYIESNFGTRIVKLAIIQPQPFEERI
jgi:hypothetical protein